MGRKARIERIVALAVVLGWTAARAGEGGGGAVLPGHYIVRLKAGANPADVARGHGVRPRFLYRAAVHGLAAPLTAGQLRALQGDPRVAEIIPDRIIVATPRPDNPGKGGGKKPKPGEVVPAGVARIGAPSVSYTGGGVGVAVVDTGLDFAHQDLAIGEGSFSAFGDSAQDDDGHGTHVGGIIAALHNEIDVIGVAPDATLYAVKVLDNTGTGSDATVLAGLEWIAHNANGVTPPIRVVNMSLGRPGTLGDDSALRAACQAIHDMDISIVVSAGNDCDEEVSDMVPATYPEVMAIASTTADDGSGKCRWSSAIIAADTASYFTTDGAFDETSGIGVTISAPGENREDINRACFIKSVGILSLKLGGGTTRMSGTSMAAPHVAGVVALMWEKALAPDPEATLDPEDVRWTLRSTADGSGSVPSGSPTSCYTFDEEQEGIVWAPGALGS